MKRTDGYNATVDRLYTRMELVAGVGRVQFQREEGSDKLTVQGVRFDLYCEARYHSGHAWERHATGTYSLRVVRSHVDGPPWLASASKTYPPRKDGTYDTESLGSWAEDELQVALAHRRKVAAQEEHYQGILDTAKGRRNGSALILEGQLAQAKAKGKDTLELVGTPEQIRQVVELLVANGLLDKPQA